MSGDVLLEAEHLRYLYPHQAESALSDVGLALPRGKAFGLLGPNGSGKSTLISILLGLRLPQGGSVRYIGGKRPVIGWVPQDYAFYPDLSCRENLQFFAGTLCLRSAESAERVKNAIDDCRLGDFADKRARQCSGGVRRRLNFGIALLQRPDVLLLDEPTVGVDPDSRSFLLDRVRGLVRAGAAVLYATHYMEEASAVCSHILLMDKGKVVESGELHALLSGGGGRPTFSDLGALFTYYTQRPLHD